MKLRETAALVIVALVGAPLVFFFARAMADGTVRYRETPLRALFGDALYEELAAGNPTPKHYLGRTLGMPSFTLPDRHGKPYQFKQGNGRVTVLNIWSITCPPCVEELPTLEVLAQVAEGWGDVDVVGVSVDAGWDAVSTILPAKPRMKHLFDSEKKFVTDTLGTRLFPETWIVDRQGVVRLRFDGQVDWSSPTVVELIDSFR